MGSLGYQPGWNAPATGKVNMASRWYSPATGQFTSRDGANNSPVPDPAAANTFAYGAGNPLPPSYPLVPTPRAHAGCGAPPVGTYHLSSLFSCPRALSGACR